MELLAQVLTIYSWSVVCVLLFFLFGIARFFEQRLKEKATDSSQSAFYPLILIPAAMFIASAIIYVVLQPTMIVGNPLADTLRIIGGVILSIAGYRLLTSMIGGRS